MTRALATTTKGNKGLHATNATRRLSVEQENAIDRLVTGETDAAVAKAVGVHRVTVTKWRLYDPAFAAALNDRRARLWGEAADRFASLLPLAFDVLAKELANDYGPFRFNIAMNLIRLLKPSLPQNLPTDPHVLAREMAKQRQADAEQRKNDADCKRAGIPDTLTDHVEAVWAESAGVEGPVNAE
jgi:hypothetical protein